MSNRVLSEKVLTKIGLKRWNIELVFTNLAFQMSGVFVNGFVISAYLVNVLEATPSFVGIMAAMTVLPNSLMPLSSIVLEKIKRKKLFTLVMLGLGRLFYLSALVYGYVANRNGVKPETQWGVAIICLFACSMSTFGNGVNEWLSNVLPDNARSQKLAVRNIIINASNVVGILLASTMIKQIGVHISFPILFAIAFVFMAIGMVVLFNVYWPEVQKEKNVAGIWMYIEAFKDKNFMSFLFVVISSTVAVYLLLPFFTIFYLDYFKAPYDIVGYMSALTTLFLVFGIFFFGKFITITGSRLVSKMTMFLLGVLPLFWFIVPTENYMLPMLVLALSYSFVQGGWAISITSSGFSIADKSKSLVYISIYSSVAAICQMFAPIIAGNLAEFYGIHKPFASRVLLPNQLMILFIFSALVQFFALAIFPRYRVQKDKANLRMRDLMLRGDFYFVLNRLRTAAFMPNYSLDRKKLAEEMGELKSAAVLKPLVVLLNDLNQDVRLNAIDSISKIPDQASVDILMDFYEEANLLERHAVVRAYANFTDKRTEDFLFDTYISDNTLMRAEAAYSLSKRGSEKAKDITLDKLAMEQYTTDEFLTFLPILAVNKAYEALHIIIDNYKKMEKTRNKEYTLYYMSVLLETDEEYYKMRIPEGEHPVKNSLSKMIKTLKNLSKTSKEKKELSKAFIELSKLVDREEDISLLPYSDTILLVINENFTGPNTLYMLTYFLKKEVLNIAEVEFVSATIKSLLYKKHFYEDIINPKKLFEDLRKKIMTNKDN